MTLYCSSCGRPVVLNASRDDRVMRLCFICRTFQELLNKKVKFPLVKVNTP